MAKSFTSTSLGDTRDVPVDDWIPFLAEFTRENRGAHAVLEVFDKGIGRQIATEDRPFDGISADTKDGERVVWITFGSAAPDHFTYGVHSATAIRVRVASPDTGAAIEIDARDGTRTLLTMSRPEDYALPPADSGESRRPSV